jgi:hypothetical protein
MPYICEICNKNYKSYQSLWNHNKKFHKDLSSNITIIPQNTTQNDNNTTIIPQNTTLNKLECKNCNKILSRYDSLKRHELKCKNNYINNNITKNELDKLKEEIREELRKDIMNEIIKSCKIHPKTFNKINKQINNNNYINIIQLGNESISDLFSQNQQIGILKYRHQCLSKLIKEVHFNDKYPQFKNILITNTQNNIAYKYDNNENNFVAIDKKELLDDIISERMGDIETFYDNQLDFLDNKTKEVIKFFINKMEDENSEYYENRVKEIKLLIYNNRNKVSKDLEIIL